jgi:bacterioferritin
MRGNKDVIEQLNEALSLELTAIVQYIVQGEMCDRWGYKRLGAYIQKQAIGEMHHAEGLIERILFLNGTPDVKVGLKPKISNNVKGQLQDDLKDEVDAVHSYNAAIAVCTKVGDDGSRTLFESMVKDEEGHADWLEAQLHAIDEIGLDRWLTQQIEPAK